MLKYVIQRIILIPILVVATTLAIFLLISLTPDDPAVQMLPTFYTQEQLDDMHVQLGLDKPLLMQYVNWLGKAVQGDFGISYSKKIPVWEAISYRVPTSLKLALFTTLFIVICGLPLGVMCAVKQYKAFDSIVNVGAKFFSAFPNFWLSMMLVLVFSFKLKWLPAFGSGSFLHWILPVISLAVPDLGGYLRQSRNSMLDCIRQDYVRTARSKGAKERQVIFRDALRPALLPVITATGQRFAMLLGNAVVVETCFSFPGLGSIMIDGIMVKDTNIILAGAAILSAVFIVMMLIVDLAYAFVDPRIKSAYMKKKKAAKVKAGEEAA